MGKEYVRYKKKKYKVYYQGGQMGLSLSDCGLSSIDQIEGLKSLTDLRRLHLKNNNITEIKGLETLTNLEMLSLSGNQITEIKGLETLTNLVYLYLDRNQITEIKGLEKLQSLSEVNLADNQITEIKGLEKLYKLYRIYLKGNPISNEIFEKLGGVDNLGQMSGSKVVDYCILKKKEPEEQERKKEEEERRRWEEHEMLVREKPCEICKKKEIEKHDCPDCGRMVCVNCWDVDFGVCIACKDKFKLLKEGATPSPTEAVQPSQTNIISDKERFLKLRNALQMSKKVPISALTKSLSFNSADDLSAWLFEVGIFGLEIDYDNNMVKMNDPEALEMLEMLMQEDN